jgi:hypothetical protein
VRAHQVLPRFFFILIRFSPSKCDGTAIIGSYIGLLMDFVMYWMRIPYTGVVLHLDRHEKCEIWEFAQQGLINE